MSIDSIKPEDFDYISTKLHDFFKSKRLIEVPVQHRLSILGACEDPTTITIFNYVGLTWPLPQTGRKGVERIFVVEIC